MNEIKNKKEEKWAELSSQLGLESMTLEDLDALDYAIAKQKNRIHKDEENKEKEALKKQYQGKWFDVPDAEEPGIYYIEEIESKYWTKVRYITDYMDEDDGEAAVEYQEARVYGLMQSKLNMIGNEQKKAPIETATELNKEQVYERLNQAYRKITMRMIEGKE